MQTDEMELEWIEKELKDREKDLLVKDGYKDEMVEIIKKVFMRWNSRMPTEEEIEQEFSYIVRAMGRYRGFIQKDANLG